MDSPVSPTKPTWFHRPRSLSTPRMRLFCFPYAGGAATAFHSWPAELPDDVDVWAIALPGRSFRLREPPLRDMVHLLDALEPAMTAALDRPYAMFGHSMGANIAFELARRLLARGLRPPMHLMLSGQRAPHLAAARTNVHRLPDLEFREHMRAFYGSRAQMLEDDELRNLIEPALRADLELLETWTSPAGPPLPLPITTFAGSDDAGVDVGAVSAWRRYTHGAFSNHVLAGDHMFLHTAQRQLLALMSRML